MKFSIIVVSLNPGEKLKKTLASIFAQTYTDYEVVLKDGGSTDGSVEMWSRGWSRGDGSFGTQKKTLPGQQETIVQESKQRSQAEAEYGSAESRVRFICQTDTGIYDAMNQAVSYAKGEYILFLNCGDLFADEKVLERTAAVIDGERAVQKSGAYKAQKVGACETIESKEAGGKQERKENLVLYGDTLSEKNSVVIAAPPEITGFTCYRNIPCHQSCFYSAVLCKEKPYELQYKIRADYEHFLWCFYEAGAKMVYLDFPVAVYEGGGYSESKANLLRDKQEHKRITATYIPKKELLKYKMIMALTLAPMRRKMAENKAFTGIYHWVKGKLYKK